ncbi:hypothetical protein ACHQM5_016124 [Ranunculus cassubicifolius]
MSDEPKVKKPKSLTSRVWNDFDRVKEGETLVAICKHCNKKLSGKSSGGTSHLRSHLLRCMKKRRMSRGQKLLNVKQEDGVTKVENFEFDDVRSRREFAEMVVFHELPFAFAGYVGVKRFLKNVQPLYPLRGPKTLRSDCMKVYEAQKEKMYEKLDRVVGRISVTSDMWTCSTQKLGYMALTAHYVDDDWVLKKRVLNFLQVDVPHNAIKLSQAITACLMEWNIDAKLFSMSLDNCSTNDCMANIVCQQLNVRGVLLVNGKFFHVRCAAHILNIIVQEGWKALGVGSKNKEQDVLDKVRESVKFVTNSANREKLFAEVSKQARVSCRKSLFLDCQTRWNSTHDMLEVAMEYKDAFDRLRARDSEFNIEITAEEWANVKDVSNCLETFHKLTKIFSGTKYPTSNLFFHQICELNLAISKWECSQNPFVKKMASCMRVKYDKYWEISHASLAVASIIDPCYKYELLDYYFPLFYDKEVVSDLISDMKTSFENLYNEYASDLPSSMSYEVGDEDNVIGAELSGFDQFIRQKSKNHVTKRDLECYLDEPVLPRSKDFDILGWWKANGGKYPILAKMARDILAIPISTVASESVFSTGGRVVDKYRSSMGTATAQALICGQDWLRDVFNGMQALLFCYL